MKTALRPLAQVLTEALVPGASAAVEEMTAACAEAAQYGLTQDEIVKLLYPDGGRISQLVRLSELQPIAGEVARLRDVAARGHLSAAARELLEQAIASEKRHEDEVL